MCVWESIMPGKPVYRRKSIVSTRAGIAPPEVIDDRAASGVARLEHIDRENSDAFHQQRGAEFPRLAGDQIHKRVGAFVVDNDGQRRFLLRRRRPEKNGVDDFALGFAGEPQMRQVRLRLLERDFFPGKL